MKDETPAWLSYTDENLDVAVLSLANNHLGKLFEENRPWMNVK